MIVTIRIIEENLKIFNLLKERVIDTAGEKIIFTGYNSYISGDILENIDGIRIVTPVKSHDAMYINISSGNTELIICDTENARGLKNISENVQIITCGLKEKDSFTYTSDNEDYIIMSLQRNVKNIYGEIIKPFELRTERLKSAELSDSLFVHCILLCIQKT